MALAQDISPEGGFGYRIGMTQQEALEATEWPMHPAIDEGGACEEYMVGDDVGFFVMVEDGKATRVAAHGGGFKTAEGVAIGDPAEKVRAVYGPKVIRETAPYTGEPDYDLYVWTAPDRGYRFAISDDGMVEVIYAGTRSIEYIEGCL